MELVYDDFQEVSKESLLVIVSPVSLLPNRKKSSFRGLSHGKKAKKKGPPSAVTLCRRI